MIYADKGNDLRNTNWFELTQLVFLINIIARVYNLPAKDQKALILTMYLHKVVHFRQKQRRLYQINMAYTG